MAIVEGRVFVGVDGPAGASAFPDVDSFLDRLEGIGTEHGVAIQALDARYVAGPAHVELALDLARRAHERGDAIADDPAVEILLYAAGRRQINRALEMGIDEGVSPIVVAIDGDAGAAVEAVRTVVEPADAFDAAEPARIRSFFGIGDTELAATDASLEDLVCERVALLVVEK